METELGLEGHDSSDEALMRSFSLGNQASFDQLFERYRRRVFTYLLHQVGGRAPAEDLFQEIFLRVIRSRATYQPQGSFRSWLFTIAHNALADARRRDGVRDERQEVDGMKPNSVEHGQGIDGDPEADPLRRLEGGEMRARIRAALERLPAEQREVFLLRERAQLDFARIAEITGCGVATAKSRMRYALRSLRESLAGILEQVPGGQA